MVEALLAWLALGPDKITARISYSENLHGRGSDGDIHQVFSTTWDYFRLDCIGARLDEAIGTCYGATEGVVQAVEMGGG